ncbi:MAG TPA: PAS domain-containing sensor histidine kinase [Exilispira sp.]|nr:PAS domain-containing sensor histidine kinase [Exilispira sp.]
MAFELSTLQSSVEFFNLLFNTIPTAIFVVDENMRITSFNNSLANIFGKDPSQIVCNLCGNALGCSYQVEENLNCGETEKCDTCDIRSSIIDAIKDKKRTISYVLEKDFYINDKKIKKYLDISVFPINFDKRIMAVLFIEDKTQLLTSNIELQKAIKQKNELLGVAAHDIRNPLTIFKLYIDFIKTHITYDQDQNLTKAFSVIDETISHMINLLNDILDFSNIESGILSLNVIKVDIVHLIKDIAATQQLIANDKNIKINFESDQNSIIINCDIDKISQAIINLINNAVKYSFENSEVTVKVSFQAHSGGSSVKIEVIDKGPGIPESEQDKLFKPFSRTSVRPTARESSTGLGLAIAKKIVEAHNGKIGVVTKENAGSNFWIVLPIL